MRKIVFFLMILLACSCAPQSNQETSILQTHVAELSTEISKDNSGFNKQPDVVISDDGNTSDLVAAQKSEEIFLVLLANKLMEKGWVTDDIFDNSFLDYNAERWHFSD